MSSDARDDKHWWSGRGKVAKTFAADPALAAQARALKSSSGTRQIDEEEIEDGGGWRNDERKKTHWLKLRQLIAYGEADLRITDDAEFWRWFEDYRKTEDIGQSRGGVSFGGYSSGSTGWSKDYLSDWWKGWGYHGAADKDRKLAVALSAASTTVSVINTSGVRYAVRYARKTNDNDGMMPTYTDLDGKEVVISPEPVLDKKLTDEQAIRITTGLALHEGSHTEYTPSVASVLEQPTPLGPARVSTLLLNVLEDLRIERLTGEKFPGFAEYFIDIHDWGWGKLANIAPRTWGPELKDKLQTVITSTKWADEYEPLARGDATLSTEFDWWKDWGATYRDGPDNSTARKLVEDGLARLREDPKTAQELDQMQKEEDEFREARSLSDAEFEDFMRALKEQLKNGLPDACPSPDRGQRQPIELTAEQAQEVKRLVDEKLQIDFSQFPDAATGPAPEIVITKPLESEESRVSYQPPNRSLVAKIKANFFFRKRIPVYDDRMLKKGYVDDEELWRIADNDFRVFLQRQVEEQDYVAATMLIDCSGSMSGENIHRAQMLATVLLECFSTMPHARVKIRGHSHIGDNDCQVYRIWEPGDPRTRLGLFEYVPSGSNYDGYAIEWCAREMLQDARPDETKLLIVLSDGRPNGGHNYRGTPAMKHVRWVTDHFGKKDIAIFQIAVDPGVGANDQAVMFAHWMPYDANNLPMKLGRLLIKLFGASQ